MAKRERKVQPAIERFFAKVRLQVPLDISSCWLWTGYTQPNGYGQFKSDGRRGAKRNSPHRFAYEYFVQTIPPSYEVDHLCKQRNCCNPNHLQAVTLQENRQRRSGGAMGYSNRDLARLTANICIRCQLRFSPDGIHCHQCRIAVNQAKRKRYRAAHNIATCPVCERGRVITGKRICQACQDTRDKARWEKYWTKKGRL